MFTTDQHVGVLFRTLLDNWHSKIPRPFTTPCTDEHWCQWCHQWKSPEASTHSRHNKPYTGGPSHDWLMAAISLSFQHYQACATSTDIIIQARKWTICFMTKYLWSKELISKCIEIS